uniref:Uncharacterized protein n=1 Tax=Haemonchus contortus TaxID=6289 RepID=W6NEN7_HAECO
MTITFQSGLCATTFSSQLVIITFLDHWYPPDMLDGAQLVDNSIVLDGARLGYYYDPFGRSIPYPFTYKVYIKDSDRRYESIRKLVLRLRSLPGLVIATFIKAVLDTEPE